MFDDRHAHQAQRNNQHHIGQRMQYRLADLLNEALKELRALQPHFREGSPDRNDRLCRVLEALPHPRVSEEVGSQTIEFLPQEVDCPRAAVGNEYRKIQAIIACLDKQDEWDLNLKLSPIAVDLKYALVNYDLLRHPPLRRVTDAVSENTDAALERAVIEFVESFEAVFHYDWSYTCMGLGIDGPASNEVNKRTFLEPGLTAADEFEDWGNRGRLLQTYRKLASVLRQRGFLPVILHPRKEDWLYGDVQLTRAWRDESESSGPGIDTEPDPQAEHL